MNQPYCTTHEEVDAYYAKLEASAPDDDYANWLYQGYILKRWLQAKLEIDDFGHSPIKQAKIINLHVSKEIMANE